MTDQQQPDEQPRTAHYQRTGKSKAPTDPAGQSAAIEGTLAALGYETGHSYSSVEISRRVQEQTAMSRLQANILAEIERFNRERRAEIIAAGGDPDEDRDPFEYVRVIADQWAETADDPDGRAALLDQLADRLDTSEVRALRLAAEAAAAITPRLIVADADARVRAADTANDLGVTESYVYRVLREQRTRVENQALDRPSARVAYDLGDAVHVMDVDQHGAHDPDSVEVLPLDGDRDDALAAAGYRTVGEWTQQGDAEGVTVERDQ